MPANPPHEVRYLDLADHLYLAGAALDAAPQAVFDVADLGLAESALKHRRRRSPASSSTPTSSKPPM